MEQSGAINSLIRRARRRMLVNLAAEPVVSGGIALSGGAVVLLLVGTGIFDWYWLALLFAAGAGASAWRAAGRIPTAYEAAQKVDARLGLKDALSTALHFHETTASRRATLAVVALQRSHAESMAAPARAADAVPWRLPSRSPALAVVAAGALLLFGIRYGVQGSLDLRQPIVSALPDFFIPAGERAAANGPKREKPVDPFESENPEADALADVDQKLDPAPYDVIADSQIPDADVVEQRESVPMGQNLMQAEVDKVQEAPSNDPASRPQTPGSSERDRQSGDSRESGKQTQERKAQESTLWDKMMDAFAGMAGKLSTNPDQGNSADQKAAEGDREGGRTSTQQAKQNGNNGDKGDGQPGQEGDSQQQAEATSPGGAGAQEKGGNNSPEPGESGNSQGNEASAGATNGSKALKEAEQLEAMGKLTELFGRRAQNVTGEVLVEVNGSKQQQLRTAYTNTGATHQEAGGEIHRDEIPLRFQQYVEQYFERVRKAPPPAPEAAQGEAAGSTKN